MADIPVSALTPRQQKLVENARVALEAGNTDFALEACNQILEAVPGCVEVRRIHRLAQLREFQGRNRTLARALGGLSSTPFIFSSVSRNPLKSLGNAEKILATDPNSTAALKLLADSAMALNLPETAAFARNVVRELTPDDAENLASLARAWIAAGNPPQAMAAGEALVRLKPQDPEAQELLRQASLAHSAPVPAAATGSGVAPEPREAGTEAVEELRDWLARLHVELAEAPERLETLREIIQCYRRLGSIADALAWVGRARRLSAGMTDVALSRLEAELGEEALAAQLRSAESALIGSPGDPEMQARVDAARRELASFRLYEAKRQAELKPNDLVARLALAEACVEHGQAAVAIRHFEAAVQGPATRLPALIGLARAQRLTGHVDKAVTHFILAKAELGTMTDEKKRVLYQLGECYEQMGRRSDAVAQYKEIYAEDIEYRDVAAKINGFFA